MSIQRLRITNLIKQAMLSDASLSMKPKEEFDAIARRLERGCYNKTVAEFTTLHGDLSWENQQFLQYYSSVAAKLAINLDAESSLQSDYLIEYIKEATDLTTVADMSSVEINPMASKEERDMIDIRLQQKVEEKYTTRYRCGKCRKQKCSYREVQIAAADESCSYSLTCLECGHAWVTKN